MAAAAAGGAGATVGARAVFAGVDDFLGGLRAIGGALGDFAGAGGGLGGTNTRLAEATAGFRQFNTAAAATGLVIGGIQTAASTLTAPVRAVGTIFTTVADEVVEGAGKMVGAIEGVVDASLSVSEHGLLGFAALGSAITSLAATAILESAKYQRGMKDIEAVSQVSGSRLDDLDVSIRRVGTTFPAAIGDIQRAALELSKAGVPIDAIKTSILDLTVATEQLATGELSAEQAAEAIGSNLKLFSKSFEDSGDDVERQAARIINSIQSIANQTRASSSEVISAITKLGPNTAVLGASIEQTAALAGLVVAQGPRGQEAGTALANLFQRLENPSAGAAKILQKRPDLNLFTEEGLPRPPSDVLKSFQDTYGAVLRTGQAIDGLTPAMATAETAELVQTRSLRTLNLVLGLSTDEYDKYLEKISETNVIAQAAVQNEALLRQLGILVNNARLAGVAFGRDFVEGLGLGVNKLNEFLASGERAQQLAGVIGKAAASIVSGRGDDNARAAVSDSPFGEGGTRVFDTLFASTEKLRGGLQDLVRDGGELASTLGKIVFPDGVEGAVSGAGDLLNGIVGFADDVIKKFNELAPVAADALGNIVGAHSFDELLSNVKSFAKEFTSIFTGEGGDESFKRLTAAGAAFFESVRGEAGPTILALANLARAVEDNAPQFLKLLDTGVHVFAGLTRAVAGFAEFTTRIVGNQIKGFTDFFDFLGGASSRLSTGIVPGVNAPEGSPPVDLGFTRPQRSTASNASRDQAEAALQGGALSREETLAALNAKLPTDLTKPVTGLEGVDLEDRARDVDTFKTSEELAAVAAEEFARSQGDAADAADAAAAAAERSRGAFNTAAQDQKDAEAAAKALKSANDSLASAMRTLDKDVTDVGGSFDKTVQGARQRWLDGMDQIAESTKDAAERIIRSASEARTKAVESFNIQTERSGGFRVSLDENGQISTDLENEIVGFNTIFRRGQEEEKRIFTQGQEDIKTFRSQVNENENTAAARHNEDLSRIETQGQEIFARTRRQGIEDQERERTRAQERELTSFTRGQEQQLTVFQRGQQNVATARQQAREDARASEQLGRDLAAATSPEGRTRVLTDFTEQRRKTAQARQDATEDTKFQQQQQDQLTSFQRTQQDSLTKERQRVEDENVKHTRDLETADLNFRKLQELELIAFRRGLEEQETFRRRLQARIELERSRRDQIVATGFSRGQEEQQTLFNFQNERVTDLQRQLDQVNQGERDQLQNTAETAARSVLRNTETFTRGVQAAGATSEETLRRLGERFENEAANLLQRIPESQRAELEGRIAGQRQVLAAEIQIARIRGQGSQGGLNSEVSIATQRAIDQLSLISPNVGSIASIFGENTIQQSVTTPLSDTPQIDRLTRALENLTNKIDKIAPGTNIENQNVTVTPTIGRGTLGPVGAS